MSVILLSTFAAEEATGLATLGINPKALLLQAATFVILYFLFRKFAMAKVVKTLEDRRAKIQEGLDNADLMQKELADLEVKTEEQLKAARVEGDAVIAKAHEESGHLIAEAEKSAVKRAENIIIDSHRTTEANVSKARTELKNELLDMVVNATETVLDEKIDLKKDGQLIEKALTGVKK